MQVVKSGDGLVVRIPANTVEVLGLREGDDVEIQITHHRAAGDEKRERSAGALAHLRQYRGRLPADYRFNRQEANGREKDIH